MGFESEFLGLPSLFLICGLLLCFINRKKPSVFLDIGFLAAAIPLFCFGLQVTNLQGQALGPDLGIGIILMKLASPFLLLFLALWVPLRLLSPRAEKKSQPPQAL